MRTDEKSLAMHYNKKGKIEVISTVSENDRELAYSSGVARPCLEIEKDVEKSYDLTRRWNMCLVVTDGSSVLGLGDLGPEAGMPAMEAKCSLFKELGDVDAFPICIKSNDVDEIVRTIYLISGSFGGVNVEDISSPRCFEIERRLKEICDIPIFHNDQHGTAIAVLAGLKNALKVVGKQLEEIFAVICGAGSAGIAISRLLLDAGCKNIILCDSKGAIYEGRKENMNQIKDEISKLTNIAKKKGDLEDIIVGADVFIGVSTSGVLKSEMVKNMAKDPIVFACAIPDPEIDPEEAKAGGAKVVATGLGDYPNQVNNVLAFPGVFRGVFDVKASDINKEMKLAAADAIAGLIMDEELNSDNIVPSAFDPEVAKAVAAAVSQAARKTGVARN
ncbi:MAG: NADP-dependent malic enzyme [Clostridiales bacterium]|nr:NADP-dependent malic enzyme [Clostridiales bacterium]